MKKLKWLVLMLTAVSLLAAPSPQAAAAPAKKAKTTTAVTKPATEATLVDINTASKEELDALPGIGKVRGAAIIKGRPYANKTQLVSKGVLKQPVYDKIADKIIAKQK